MEGSEKEFAKCEGVDPLLLLAINHHESNYCRAYPEFVNSLRHNCGGIMNPGGERAGLRSYSSYNAFVAHHCQLLTGYLKDGRTTVQAISQRYAPTSNPLNANWTGAVMSKYQKLWAAYNSYIEK